MPQKLMCLGHFKKVEIEFTTLSISTTLIYSFASEVEALSSNVSSTS